MRAGKDPIETVRCTSKGSPRMSRAITRSNPDALSLSPATSHMQALRQCVLPGPMILVQLDRIEDLVAFAVRQNQSLGHELL